MPENFDVANGAAFTDILEIGIDASGFRQGLEQLRTIYNEFVSTLGSGVTSNDIINVGSFQALKTNLDALITNLNGVKKEFTETFADVTGGIVESLSQISAAVSKKSGSKSMVTDLVGSDADVEAAEKRIIEVDGIQTEVSEKEFLRMEKIARQQAATQDQMASAAEREADRESAAREKVGRLHAQVLDKMAADAEKTADKEIAATERLARMQEQAYFAMQKDFEKRADAQAAAQEKANKAAGAGNTNPFAKWALGIAESFAGLVEFMVILQGVQLLIEAVTLPFKLMAGFIQDGVGYLTKLQTVAAELQGVLANTVEFTNKGFVENFKLAGEGADYVLKQLQLISTKINIPVGNLVSSFKAVAESGGASFVKDLNDMVRLSEFFAIAVKATGKDFQVQRTIISEIPQLLNGTETAQSKILETLGLTKDKWDAIRASGEKNKDLAEQLEPVLKPFLTVAEQADLRMEALSQKLELIKNRLAAGFVGTAFQAVIGLMAELADWLDRNQNKLESLLTALGSLVVEWLSGFGKMLEILKQLTGINFSASGILLFLELVVSGARKAVAGFQYLFDVIKAGAQANVLKPFESVDKVTAGLKAAADNFAKANQDIDKNIATFLTDSDSQDGNLSVLGGRKPPPDTSKGNAALAQAKREFQEEVEQIKQFYKTLEDERKKALDTGAINMKAYTETVTMLANDEKTAFEKALKAFDEKARKTGAPNKSINAATGSAKEAILKDTGTVNNQIRALDDSLAKYEYKLQEDALEHSRKLSVDQLKDELQLAQAKGATKTKIAQLDIGIEEKEYQNQKAILTQELVDVGNNEKAKQDIKFKADQLDLQHATTVQLDKKKLDKAVLDDVIESNKAASAAEHARYNQLVAQQQGVNAVRNSQVQLAASNLELAKTNLGVINDDVIRAQDAYNLAKSLGVEKSVVDALKKSLDDLKAARDKATQTVIQDQKESDGDQARLDMLQSIFGKGVKDLGDVFQQGFAQGAANLLNAFTFFKTTITGFINAFKQGQQSGGVLGGIGAVASQVGGDLSKIFPIAGPIIAGAGQVLSFIGGLFQQAAQKLADQIQKAFDTTIQNFRNGSINLTQTLQQLEQERANAIAQLSGKKGGQDQLDKLLPEIDDQLASLKQQQTQTLQTFEQQLTALNLQSDTLSKVYNTWIDINKQVTDYLAAGGSVAKANQFLSDSIKQIQQQTQDSLNQGEETAVQDAIQLNDLLNQRLQLIQSIAKNEFDATTADSLERTQAGAISRGTALSQLKSDDAKQLTDLNSQIDLQTQKVTLESQVFDIATDITALHAQDNALQIAALNEQISQWKDMQTIINNIINTNGVYSLSAFLMSLFGLTPPVTPPGKPGTGGGTKTGGPIFTPPILGGGPVTIGPVQSESFGAGVINGQSGSSSGSTLVQVGTISITATGDPTTIGGQIVDSLTSEIEKRVKQGSGQFFRA